MRIGSASYSLMGEIASMCNMTNVSACALAKTLDIELWRRNITANQFRGWRRGSTGFALSFSVQNDMDQSVHPAQGKHRSVLSKNADKRIIREPQDLGVLGPASATTLANDHRVSF